MNVDNTSNEIMFSSDEMNQDTEAAVGKDKLEAKVYKVENLSMYKGETLTEKIKVFVQTHGVVIFSKSFCPFCLDIKEFLTREKGVPVYALEVNEADQGAEIYDIVKAQTGHKTVPAVYIKGRFVGGCDDVKALETKDTLQDLIQDVIVIQEVADAHQLETAKLLQRDRGEAVHPPFWAPPQANNYVVRITSLFTVIICVILVIFREEDWTKWVSAALMIDFGIRTTVGASLSPLAMIGVVATATTEPQLVTGVSKQFGASIGTVFMATATACFFTEQEVVASVVLASLALFAALEAFFSYCVACHFFQEGIKYGLVSPNVHRVYTTIRQEFLDTWNYVHNDANTPIPERVDTDPNSKISLKYKKKTDEWTKDDFHLIRHMMPCYFAIPLSLSGLSTAFKLGSGYTNMFRGPNMDEDVLVVPDAWYQVFAVLAAVSFVLLGTLFGLRLLYHPRKCWTEWTCPQRSPSYGGITITLMLLAFLLHDEIKSDSEQWPQKMARTVYWMAALAHSLMTVCKISEWVGLRADFEHIHPQWLIFPVGLIVASFGVVVPFFEGSDLHHKEANVLIARFFFSIGYLLWIAIFTLTLYKAIVGHNSDPRTRVSSIQVHKLFLRRLATASHAHPLHDSMVFGFGWDPHAGLV